MFRDETQSPWRRDAQLFLVSVLILFLELVMIRWIGTKIRVFAYLGNLILVVCFFGVGLGCYRSAARPQFGRLGLNLFLLAALVANPFQSARLDFTRITDYLNGFQDSLMFTASVGWTWWHFASGFAMMAVLLYLLTFIFVPVGQLLGQLFENQPRIIRAYSINIAGSLAGVWLLNALSLARLTPPWWFAVAAVLIAAIVLLSNRREWSAAVWGVLIVAVVWWGARSETMTVWSPYHRLSLSPDVIVDGTNEVPAGYILSVNDTFFQRMENRSPDFVAAHPTFFNDAYKKATYYTGPFWLKPHAKRILVVGAGSGNNAAEALRNGVDQIDCVEIDPEIYALGKRLHPEHPYDSPHVQVTIEDARAYFKRARGSYDIIWFAVLDSHTLGSSYNNLRLDHYVYTLESLQEARKLLAKDGIIFLTFGAERYWIGDRLHEVMQETFGHPPLAYAPQSSGAVTLIGSDTPVTADSLPEPDRSFMQTHRLKIDTGVRITTDDWPYLYLQEPRIPKLHLVTTLAILGAVLLVGRGRLAAKSGSFNWHFFALGAAFLLLEVQTVSRAALLFGMTWFVNAVVISAVLVMILLANLVTAWRPNFPRWFVVTGLAVTVGALVVVPLDWFNTLGGPTKLIAASLFLTAPAFFGGLLFIRSFAACADKSQALGANLIGALVGGLLESLSFVTGIRALVLLVGIFYIVALLARPVPRKMATVSGSA